ncbi:MAG: SMC-Scp complex subunit ScpB [Ignavibacteriales bacterium]|nr:SMC-Scp complex subunit ScpB [Ignavibacteriales bacterium]
MAETITTTQPGAMLQVPTSVRSLVEALIFGAREPLTVRQIQALYEDQGTEGAEPRKISYDEIAQVVEELNAEYTSSDKPFRVIQIAGGYQFATLPAYAEWLGKLYKEQTRRKLSQSSVETLAIIAYKQPITKPELEAIRGVNCDYVLSTLLEKDLATIVGRAPTVGRPLLYGTSREFLRHFGLNDLNDLPKPREIQEILGDSQFETERRMLEAQQGMEEVKQEEDFKSRLPHIPKRKAGLDDDVKILPRKRTREIKVRLADEAGAVTPEAAKEEQSVNVSPETVSASMLEDQPVVVSDELAPSESGAVPTVDNELTIQSQPSEPEVDSSDVLLSAEQSRYIGLTQSDSTEPLVGPEEVVSEEKASPVVEDHLELAPKVLELPAEEENPLVIEEESADEATAADTVQEIDTETVLPADVAVKDVIPTQKDDTASAGETVKDITEFTPQAVPPTSADHTEVVWYTESEMAHADEPDAHNGSQPKTRWKSWKEKIQGFIKKLFG